MPPSALLACARCALGMQQKPHGFGSFHPSYLQKLSRNEQNWDYFLIIVEVARPTHADRASLWPSRSRGSSLLLCSSPPPVVASLGRTPLFCRPFIRKRSSCFLVYSRITLVRGTVKWYTASQGALRSTAVGRQQECIGGETHILSYILGSSSRNTAHWQESVAKKQLRGVTGAKILLVRLYAQLPCGKTRKSYLHRDSFQPYMVSSIFWSISAT